jgi:hypothetical protein
VVIYQLDVIYKWPNKLLQKPMDEKPSPSLFQNCSFSFISHKMVSAVYRG